METDKNNNDKKMHATHDFFSHNRWIYFTTGFAESRRPLYVVHIIFCILYLLYMEAASVYAAQLCPTKTYMARAFHTFLIGTFALFVIGNRLFISTCLKEMRRTLLSGIFTYTGEEMDEKGKAILDGIPGEIRFKSNAWFSMLLAGGVSNMVCFPLTQLLLVSDEEYARTPYVDNPYLPNFFWSPYNRTIPGYILMYVLNFAVLYYTYVVASCQNMIYLSWNVQFRRHFQVLNHSIENIQRRAALRYANKRKLNVETLAMDDLYEILDYQECLYACLKENVKHHQALLRLKQISMPFIGALLFIVVTMVSLFYASLFYLLLQKPPINFAINYVATFLVENCYTFFQCVFGQDIQDHSGRLFETLYGTPWFRGNKKFNQLLGIMMCYTRKPVKLKSFLFDFTANFETYAERFSLMYSIINLLR